MNCVNHMEITCHSNKIWWDWSEDHQNPITMAKKENIVLKYKDLCVDKNNMRVDNLKFFFPPASFHNCLCISSGNFFRSFFCYVINESLITTIYLTCSMLLFYSISFSFFFILFRVNDSLIDKANFGWNEYNIVCVVTYPIALQYFETRIFFIMCFSGTFQRDINEPILNCCASYLCVRSLHT